MSLGGEQHPPNETVLLVDGDVIIRMVIAEYLRACGYRVIEAATTQEARAVFELRQVEVHILLADAKGPGGVSGFELAQWVRAHHSDVDVVLVGTLEAAAGAARDICDDGPLKHPYEPQTVVARIKSLRARRAARQKK